MQLGSKEQPRPHRGQKQSICGAQLLVVLSARSTPEEAGRRRGQIFCLVEQFFLLYRALATSPAWYVYFYRGAGLGFMASVFTGGPFVNLNWQAFVA